MTDHPGLAALADQVQAACAASDLEVKAFIIFTDETFDVRTASGDGAELPGALRDAADLIAMRLENVEPPEPVVLCGQHGALNVGGKEVFIRCRLLVEHEGDHAGGLAINTTWPEDETYTGNGRDPEAEPEAVKCLRCGHEPGSHANDGCKADRGKCDCTLSQGAARSIGR